MNQDLYLVVGGDLVDVRELEFAEPSRLHVVGVFQCRDTAEKAWRGHTQMTVDNAERRYFVVPFRVG